MRGWSSNKTVLDGKCSGAASNGRYTDNFRQISGDKLTSQDRSEALKILHEKRKTALHVEPFDLYFKQGFKMPDKYGGVITTTHLTVQEETDPTGQITMRLKVGEDGPEEEVEPQISWHFSEDDPTDVMTNTARDTRFPATH